MLRLLDDDGDGDDNHDGGDDDGDDDDDDDRDDEADDCDDDDRGDDSGDDGDDGESEEQDGGHDAEYGLIMKVTVAAIALAVHDDGLVLQSYTNHLTNEHCKHMH